VAAGRPATRRRFARAEYGLKVALIEQSDKLGGTCLHVGCIPTKALLFNAEIWEHLQHAADFGIEGIGAPTLNWAAVLARKNAIIAKHANGLDFLMKKHKIARIEGYGRLTGPAQDGVHSVEVTAASGEVSQLKAKNVILATGSEAKMLPGLKAGEPHPDEYRNSLHRRASQVADRHRRGRGGHGVRSLFRTFGSEVTILEFLPRVVPVEDEEISKEITRLFKKRGIDVNTGARLRGSRRPKPA
jgi:dihydrolipoamide dehydrogenase